MPVWGRKSPGEMFRTIPNKKVSFRFVKTTRSKNGRNLKIAFIHAVFMSFSRKYTKSGVPPVPGVEYLKVPGRRSALRIVGRLSPSTGQHGRPKPVGACVGSQAGGAKIDDPGLDCATIEHGHPGRTWHTSAVLAA